FEGPTAKPPSSEGGFFTCCIHRFEPLSTKTLGAFLDSFSWPAKQANPMEGVSNPDGCAKQSNRHSAVFLFSAPKPPASAGGYHRKGFA
ncbi:hypothetical protein, partial [Rheinheimera sp.]|uniref:hypothetical protein n=1 Tax=Rheinheimera sp. TaxID=1869214 RepID=UPI00307E33D8